MGCVTVVMPFTEGEYAITIAVILAFVYGRKSFVIINDKIYLGQSITYVLHYNSILIGIAFGAYIAVDFALVMDVLPAEKT